MAEEIRVPNLGESVTEATLAKWHKKKGETVEEDELIAELETDKVSMEVNAPASGVLSEILVEEGADLEVGTLLARLDTEAKAEPKESDSKGEAASEEKANAETAQEGKKGSNKKQAEPEGKTAGKKDKSGKKKSGGGEMVDLRVPESGESVTEAELGRWLKEQGDPVAEDEPVAELETDKAAMEVSAPAAGVLAEIAVEEGATVSPGDVIGRIAKGAEAGEEVSTEPEEAVATEAPAEEEPSEKPSEEPAESAGQDRQTKKDAKDAESGGAPDRPMAPSVRRLIGDYNLDPDSIPASGKDGRITKADVLKAIEQGVAKTRLPVEAGEAGQSAGEAAAPREERMAMTRLRKRIAQRLKDAQNTAAILTTFNDVDMSAVIAARKTYRDVFEKKHGVRLGFMSFFVKAAVAALKDIPQVNARIDGDEIVYQNFYNIGVAVSAPQGLVVPVVRDADELSFAETEKTINDFGQRARDGKLSVNELQDGTFSISNGGIFGSMLSTPILNPPQAAILGMHRIEERPVARNGEVVIRPMMYLALSYDHRLVDGREAVTFLVRIKEAIEEPERLLLDL